jgi:hypothetical protein
MLDRKKALRAWLLLGMTGVVTASCSSSDGSGTGASDTSPLTLVSKCDQICNNVVAECASAAGVPYNACISACSNLSLVPSTCLNPFLSYVVCVAGATSVTVTCGTNGGSVALVSPPDCESDREAALSCNASPGLVAACIALPGNASCLAAPLGGGRNPEFCVGAPTGCAPPSPNPLGIGIYCCP